MNLKFESYLQNRDQVLAGFQMAREFLLKYQYVFRMRDLPYATQMIPLAAICAVLGKTKVNEANTTKVLTRWYWCGILGEMYGGANETRYANDIEDIVDEVYGKPNPARTVNAAFFSATRLLTLQTRLSAAYKGIMALLYKEKCRDFMNDTTIDLVNSMVQSPDIHHIFPEAYCVKSGIKRQRYNSIINKTPILPETNRSIGNFGATDILWKAIHYSLLRGICHIGDIAPYFHNYEGKIDWDGNPIETLVPSITWSSLVMVCMRYIFRIASKNVVAEAIQWDMHVRNLFQDLIGGRCYSNSLDGFLEKRKDYRAFCRLAYALFPDDKKHFISDADRTSVHAES